MLAKFYEQQLMTGLIDFDLSIATSGKTTEELIRNATGDAAIQGKDLLLYGLDLDDLLQRYKRSQRFNLVDTNAGS